MQWIYKTQFGPVIPQEIVNLLEDYKILDKEQQEDMEEKAKQNLQH